MGRKTTKFLAKEISQDTYLNMMAQYWPANKANQYPGLSRGITREEFKEAIKATQELGLYRFAKL